MKLGRWLATFLAFPVGGYLALLLLGPVTGLSSALIGGAVVGTSLGAAQWLVLRRAGVGSRLVPLTGAAMAAGNALAFAATSGGEPIAPALAGVLAGAVVGAVQSPVILRLTSSRLLWAGAVSAAWAVGRLTTAAIGVDAETASHSFGASGAIVVTVLTGLVLRWLLGRESADAASEPPQPGWRVAGAAASA